MIRTDENKFTASIIDGKQAAQQIMTNLRNIIDSMDKTPDMKLVICTTGTDDASKVYVRSKSRACDELGIRCIEVHYDYFDENACLSFTKYLKDLDFPPFIVQLPITGDFNRELIYSYLYDRISEISDDGAEVDDEGIRQLICMMDVDGIIAKDNILFNYTPHYMIDPDNHNAMDYYCMPCTPMGIMDLIINHVYHMDNLDGVNVVILGRSDLVAKPLEAFLMDRGATVTLCHTKTNKVSLRNLLYDCNVLISAMGTTDVLTKEFLGTIDCSDITLIDVGMNRDENGKLRGDCDPECLEGFFSYTPVPGGVGPMTVAALMCNVVKYYQLPNMSKYAGAVLPIYPYGKNLAKLYENGFYIYRYI